MIKLKIIFLIITLLVLSSCSPTAANTKSFKGQEEYIRRYLPLGVENVRPLGNEWVLFDIEINGKTKTFLYQESDPYRYESTGALTEVSTN